MAYINRNQVKKHEKLTDEIGNDLLRIDKEYTGGSKVWLDVEFFHKLTKYFCLSNHLVKCLQILLDKQPTADVVEVKHGKWIECFEDWRKQIVGDECSACGFRHYGTSISDYHYCPNCGAKMDLED